MWIAKLTSLAWSSHLHVIAANSSYVLQPLAEVFLPSHCFPEKFSSDRKCCAKRAMERVSNGVAVEHSAGSIAPSVPRHSGEYLSMGWACLRKPGASGLSGIMQFCRDRLVENGVPYLVSERSSSRGAW